MLKIIRENQEFSYKTFLFPAGEVGFKFEESAIEKVAFYAKTKEFQPGAPIDIITRIQNSNDFIELAMAKNAILNLLQEFPSPKVNLILPYVPYARQDRVCVKGESFSVKVFAELINGLNFTSVTICDPHSEVVPALLNNVKVISQYDIITRWSDFISRVFKNPSVFVSPDAGSNKKTSVLAKFFSHNEFVRADKLRDLSTGQIKETIVYCDDFKGKDVFCADDIIDGGRTFIELAKVCKAKNCGKFVLYATHGVFSKGVEELLNNGVDEIWTTNSYKTEYDSRVNVLDLESKFRLTQKSSLEVLKEFYQSATRL